MRFTAKKSWLLAVLTLSAACGLSASRLAWGGPLGPLKCLPLGSACFDCASTADQLRPFYCDIGGPGAPFIQGSCHEQRGVCGNWASYRCGQAIDCESGDDTGVACGWLEFCLDQ